MAKLHRDNAGYIGCSHEETQDPYYSYNKLSLPLTGATETVQRPAEVTHTVTVAGGKFVIGGVSQATLSLIEGGTYKFDQSDSSNSNHPFRFSQTSNGTWNRGTEYTKGVSYVGTPGSSGAYTQLVVPFGGLNLFYYCQQHANMGGSATTPANAGMFTAALPILKTTDQFGATLGSGVNADPFAANLVLALPMNGSNNGTTFTDQSAAIKGSGSAKAITLYTGSASGGAVISTAQSVYYGSSFYAVRGATNNYTASDYLERTGDTDFAFGTGDFTVEFWYYPTTLVSNSCHFDNRHPSTNWPNSAYGFQLNSNSSGTLLLRTGSGNVITVSSALGTGKWHHLAVTRSSGTIKVFVDGVEKGSVTNSNDFNEGRFRLGSGADNGEGSSGYYSDLRIYKGVAKYQPEGSGSLGMDVVTYTGTGGTQSVGGLAFQPDFIWCKTTSNAVDHKLADSVRGFTKILESNQTRAEVTDTNAITAVGSTGFTLGSGGDYNLNGRTYVAWCWKAGGAATTIAAGSLNSSVYDQSQTWSSGVSGSIYISQSATRAFDGDLSTFVAPASNTTLTWTPPSTLSISSSLRVYATREASEVDLTVTFSDSSTQSGFLPSNNTAGWYTVPSAAGKTLSTISWTATTQWVQLFAVEVDGKILIDSGVSVANVPSIPSSVSANTDYGFSVVSYVSNSSAVQTIGHGLSTAPKFIIWKDRDAATNWFVYHNAGTAYMFEGLNTDSAGSTTINNINNTLPSSSIFTLNSGGYTINANGNHNLIAYCWSEVAGYSKFGSYTGNGSATGPVVTTGFKPRLFMVKRTDAANNWAVFDSARSLNNDLKWNTSEVEGSAPVEFLSNGFQPKNTYSSVNANGATYIYMAFAESAPGDPGQDAFKILSTLNTKDQSSSAHSVTNNGASFQTSVKKFYDGAASFSGGSSVVIPASSDLQFGTGDFTIEGWMHPTSYGVTYPSVISKYDNGDASWIIRLHNSGQVVWYSGNGNNNASANNLALLNSWNHISAIRNSGVVTVYLNGSQILSVADTHDYNDSNAIYFGRQDVSNVNGFEGYLQDWSIYKGIAKYTSSFSPPERSIQGTARRYPSGVYVVS
jgi:hypothetical protein